MQRTDRLFELVQTMRDGRLHRAADLAADLGGVSVRTIWRDMATLIASGMPIEGERGVGYVLRAPTTLPPLMLTTAEMEALREGLRQVALGPDDTLSRAARSLAAKIGAVAPAPQTVETDDIFTFTRNATRPAEALLPLLRAAIADHDWRQITLLDGAEQPQRERLMPLRLTKSQGQRVLVARSAGGEMRQIGLDRILAVDA